MVNLKKCIAGLLAAITILSCGISVGAEFVTADDDTVQYIVDGKAVTGWFTHEGKRYYANSDGTLIVSQWKQSKDGTARYYFTKDGSVATGFVRIKGKVYYFNNKGVMQKGWIKSKSGKRYFSSKDGTMRTGWLKMKSGKKYYCNPTTGFAACGWQQIDDAYYYFDADGVMNTADLIVNGVTYTFDSEGKCQQLNDKVQSLAENNG